jgi:hypothetical protein
MSIVPRSSLRRKISDYSLGSTTAFDDSKTTGEMTVLRGESDP